MMMQALSNRCLSIIIDLQPVGRELYFSPPPPPYDGYQNVIDPY